MDAKLLNVVFVCGDKSGPHYHDIFVPTVFFHKHNLLKCESQFALNFNQLVTADVIHFQRQYAPESFLTMGHLQKAGKVCVFLCDDNVWELPPGNPARGTYEQADVIYRYQEIMAQANAVTTSTPYLVQKCREFNPNSFQFRNLVDPAIHNMVVPGRDDPREIRICWFGTQHHHDDAALIDDACLRIIHKYPKTKMIFMGYHPASLFTKYPAGRYEFYNFVNVDAFYPCFASLDIDIGLVPLIDHPFNWAKTCRKFQEFGIVGAGSIASNVGNYKDLPNDVVHKVMDFMNPDAWYEAMAHYIEQEQERKELGQRAYQYVMDNHNIETYIYERAQFYYDVYASVTGTERKIVWDETHKKGVPQPPPVEIQNPQ